MYTQRKTPQTCTELQVVNFTTLLQLVNKSQQACLFHQVATSLLKSDLFHQVATWEFLAVLSSVENLTGYKH